MYIKSDKHDKWKELINECTNMKIPKDVKQVNIKITLPVKEMTDLIDEFDQLKARYQCLVMRGHYGFR